MIKKYTNNLTIIYDGDAAGVKAALRGLDMALALEESLEVNSEDTRGLYNNLKLLMNGKDDRSQIFDGITSNKVNAFLRGLDPINVPGLTAKVFRTFITTRAVKEDFYKSSDKGRQEYIRARKNICCKNGKFEGSITCNHKKGIRS